MLAHKINVLGIVSFFVLQSVTALTEYPVSNLYIYSFIAVIASWFFIKKIIIRINISYIIIILLLLSSIVMSSIINIESFENSKPHIYNFLSICALSIFISTSVTNEDIFEFIKIYTNIFFLFSIAIIIASIFGNGDWRVVTGNEYSGGYLHLGMYLSVAFAMQLAIYGSRKNIFGRVKLLFFLIASILSLSRSAIIYVFIVLLLYSISQSPNMSSIIKSEKSALIGLEWHNKQKLTRNNILIILATLFLLPFIVYMLTPDYVVKKTLEEDSINLENSRVVLFSYYLSEFYESPILGRGAGSWGDIHPHNIFLQLMVDGGIVALFLGLIAFFMPLLTGNHHIKNSNTNKMNIHVYYAIFYSYIIVILEHFKSHEIYTGFSVMIFSGLLIAIKASAKSHYDASAHVDASYIATSLKIRKHQL